MQDQTGTGKLNYSDFENFLRVEMRVGKQALPTRVIDAVWKALDGAGTGLIAAYEFSMLMKAAANGGLRLTATREANKGTKANRPGKPSPPAAATRAVQPSQPADPSQPVRPRRATQTSRPVQASRANAAAMGNATRAVAAAAAIASRAAAAAAARSPRSRAAAPAGVAGVGGAVAVRDAKLAAVRDAKLAASLAPSPSPAERRSSARRADGNQKLSATEPTRKLSAYCAAAPQLHEALSRSAARVVGLFRAWDDDSTGNISRREFRRGLREMKFDVQAEVTDAL